MAPRKAPKPERSPLVGEIIAAIKTLPIQARFLESEESPERELIHGCCDQTAQPKITVNEAVPIVDILFHEALHAIRQTWQERTVDRRAAGLFRQLSNDEIQSIYDHYRRRVQRIRRKRVI